jgi:hypothetical protein
MYTSFEIRNFRCFRELKFDNLAQINLITGKNNVGKTALLEAAFLHGGAYNPALTLKLNAFRGIELTELTLGNWIEHPLSSFFYRFDISSDIELSGIDTITGHRSLRLRPIRQPKLEESIQGNVSVLNESNILKYNSVESGKALSTSEVTIILELEYKGTGKPIYYRMIIDKIGIRIDPLPPALSFQTSFLSAQTRIPFSEQAKLYGNLEIHGKEGSILETLKIIEPRLKRISSVTVAGGPIFHGDVGIGRLVPLPIMGDGMARLLSIVLHIANAPNGVVLIDEIENGLHYSIMTNIWRAIAFAAKESNTQVFATTHSWECVLSAHEAFESSETYDSDFQLHRLDRLNDDDIKVVTYNKRSLTAAIKAGLEVR